MKTIICILFLAVLPCFAQTTNGPTIPVPVAATNNIAAVTTNVPSSAAQDGAATDLDSIIQNRKESVKSLHDILSDPTYTKEQKAKAASLALKLLDEDSGLLAVDQATMLLLKSKIEQLGGNPAIQSLFPGAKISFTTLDGKSYKDAQVASINADSFSVITSDGGATVQMDNVDKDLQDKLGYQPPPVVPQVPVPSVSPNSASAIPASTASGNPLKNGVNITDISAKQIEDHGENVIVAWKVTIFNKGDDPIGPQWVDISFRDSADYEVCAETEKATIFKANDTTVVTSTCVMKKTLWQSVKSYQAKTE